MTLNEVAETLPNGFHDAELRRIELDYDLRSCRIQVDVWVGDMDDTSRREASPFKVSERDRHLRSHSNRAVETCG